MSNTKPQQDTGWSERFYERFTWKAHTGKRKFVFDNPHLVSQVLDFIAQEIEKSYRKGYEDAKKGI